MTRHVPTNSTFTNPHIPVQARIAAAWTSFMFIYIYVDILNFYKPGVINSILAGRIWEFDISMALLTLFLGSVSIPAMMVWLSMTLPARVNRLTNLIVAVLLIPYSIFNAAGETWDWAPFYGLSIGLEVLLLGFILHWAWTWPRTHFDAAITTADRLRQ